MPLLQALIRQTQQSEFGQGFDSASRTILMPKASLPTLSPATVADDRAGDRPVRGDRGARRLADGAAGRAAAARQPPCRASCRCASGSPRSAISTPASGTTDIFDSYVEAAVRRFQARHGITVDGIVREQTFKALNMPADVRLAQLKTNLAAPARA